MDGQLSHASPIPSPSVSCWLGLNTVGQLSCESGIPSPSVSGPVARAALKLAASKTAEIASRATKRSDLKSAKARVELFCCFFMGGVFVCSLPTKEKNRERFKKVENFQGTTDDTDITDTG